MTFLIKRIKTIYILKNKRENKQTNMRSKAHKGQELHRDELVTNVLGPVKHILQTPAKVYALREAAPPPPPIPPDPIFSQLME